MQSRDIEEAAHAIGIQTEVFHASTDNEINAAFQSIAQRRLPALLVLALRSSTRAVAT
jgi:hypothetical protein